MKHLYDRNSGGSRIQEVLLTTNYRHRAPRGVGEPFASNRTPAVIRRQGNNWLTIAAPPAVRIAHLRTRAKRRFGSSLSTATNKNAPAKQIAKTYRRTITAIKSGNLAVSGQDLLAADAIILGCPDSFPSIRQLIDAAGADCLSVASGRLSAKRAAPAAGLLLGFLRHRRG